MRFSHISLATLAFALATPAFAQDTASSGDTAPPPAITVSGSVGVYSDYRLRGVSQTDKHAAIQGSLTIAHESGFYIGTFGSNLAGWGTFGGANLELDAIAGYKHTFGGTTIDVGGTWYTYPGGASESDVVELFGRASYTLGPATVTGGVYYAPKQTSLGRIYNDANDYALGIQRNPKRWDNLYLTADAGVGIPQTPVSLRAHLGWSKGNPGLGPNGTSLAPTGDYLDWTLGADLAIRKNLTLSASYIDTNISNSDSAYLAPNFRKTTNGASISDPTVVFSLSVSF